MVKVRLRERKHGDIPRIKGGSGRVKVGFPRGTDPEAMMKAIIHNYGTRSIPERPFMDNAIRDNRKEYRELLRKYGEAILSGRMTVNAALTALGMKAAGDVQAEIAATVSPPNDPDTIARKGSSSPLVDTGDMERAVTWRKG